MEQNLEGQAEYSRGVGSTGDISGWAVGFIMFAAFMMMLMGGFHAFSGLVAIIDDAFYTTPREYFTDFSPETWGWVHLVAGIIVFTAGIALLGGAVWARLVAIVIALLSALGQLRVHPLLPGVVDHHDRRGNRRDLGAGRPRPRPRERLAGATGYGGYGGERLAVAVTVSMSSWRR